MHHSMYLNSQGSIKCNEIVKVHLLLKKQLELWSKGKADGSQSEVPRFDPHVCQKLVIAT